MGNHASKRTTAPDDLLVRRPKILRTRNSETLSNKGRPALSRLRRDAREVASTRLGLAIKLGGSSKSAVARMLGMGEHVVRRWCDPADTRTIPDGDLEVLRQRMPAVAREYRRMEEDDRELELPGLDDETHDKRITRAHLRLATAESPKQRAEALRELHACALAALRDATGEDE